MGPFLYIPWFKLTPWEIPLPGVDFSLPIQPFGVLVAIGVIVGAEVAKAMGKRRGLSPDLVADYATHVVLVGFIGAMVFNMVTYRPDRLLELIQDPQLEWPGLSSYGGFIGAIVGLFIWKRKRKMPALPVTDVIVFGLPFGWFFGRMGCFVVHDHPGVETDFFLAVDQYQFGMPPYVPRHDLGLYEVIWSACCIAILLLLARKERPVGFYIGFVILLYAPVRFFLDFLRAPPLEGGDVKYFGLTPAQYASIAFVFLGATVLYRAYTKPAPELPEHAKWHPEDEEGAKDDGAKSSSASSRPHKASAKAKRKKRS